MLIEQIVTEQHGLLARALNHNQVPWSTTDHLLADLWVLTLQAHSNDPDNTPEDHPVRHALGEPERQERQKELRAKFEERKKKYAAKKAQRQIEG